MAIKMIPINFDYLYSEARKKNIKLSEMSETLGMNKSHISQCRENGKMKEAHAKLISKLYDIDYKK